MADFVDAEAAEGEDEEELTINEKKKLKKMKQTIHDSSEEEEDDEDALREEMKDLINDNSDEEEDGSSSSDDDSGSGGGRSKTGRKRSLEDDDLDDGLEQEDYDLLEENLGVKVNRQKHLKRIRRLSDSDDDEKPQHDVSAERHDASAEAEGMEDEEVDREAGENEDVVDEEEEDIDDFLVDEDGKPVSKGPKKKRHFADPAVQKAQDIFGVNFDFDTFENYDDESDIDEEGIEIDDEATVARRAKRRKTKKKSIFEIYEPSELERGHFTDLDNKIRQTDVPERMQLRTVPVTPTENGADDPELENEADWILRHAFVKKTISKQIHDEDDDGRERIRLDASTVAKVRSVLDLMRNKHLEVPYIAAYKKEYIVPDITSNDLWKIYEWDEKWCQLQSRKKSLEKLLRRMQTYQSDLVMRDINAALPDNMRVLEESDIERLQGVDTLEELKDIHLHFKLYYGYDLPAIQEEEMKKKAEEKKSAPKKTKKASRIETNEDGEEVAVDVEVTDDEEEEAERTDLKYAVKSDAYALCRRNGLNPLCRNFGLTPVQFGENLRDTYQRHDVEQVPMEPEQMARDYITKNLETPEEVLKAAKYMVASQLSREPNVRRCAREMLFSSARLSVRPTKKGIKEIDESHYLYTMKYLKDKPVSSLRDDQFLKLVMAESEKLIEMEIGQEVTNYAGQNYVEEAKNLYSKDEFSRHVQKWNQLRGECVQVALCQMVLPALRKELRARLLEEATHCVLRQIRRRLFHWLSIAPYTPSDLVASDDDDDDEDQWDSSAGVRVLAVSFDGDAATADYACLVAADGEVLEYQKLQLLLKRRDAERAARTGEMSALREMIATRKPHVIVVGGEAREALYVAEDLRQQVQQLVSETQFPQIAVEIVDNELARVWSASARCESEFREYPPLLRQAVSLARRMQDPLVEFTQLCNADDDILCLRLHSLQEQVPRERLLHAVQIEFIGRVNEVGVDINQALNSSHYAVLLPFVCGLGVRKAEALLKTLKQAIQRLANRTELVTNCHLGPKVLTNCAGFIKIDTSALGDMTDRYIDLLDSTRIHLETYEWARKMAVDALEYDDDDDANPFSALEEILENPDRLKDLDLDAFAEELERQGLGDRSITLYDIRAELTNRYKDMRLPFTSADQLELFNMLSKETPDTLYKGKLVLCTVIGFTRRKPKPEQMNQDNPVRDPETGFWQCPFCLCKDFLELSEVWSHFDTNACPGKAIGVRIRLDNGCTGFVQMRNLSDSRVTNPEDRVQLGQTIFCRVVKIDIEKFWIECTCRSSDLTDKNHEWRPVRDSYYDVEAENVQRRLAEATQKQKHAQTYMKRVIVHPAFHNVDFKEAKRLLSTMDQGEAVIRPSSQGSDHLTVSWKVADDVVQHILVKERGKENAFSLGQTLIIDGEEFEDLDEILARHVGQLAAHARDLLGYKYYKDTNGGSRARAEQILKDEKRKTPSKIPYIVSVCKEHPGKFMLSYMPRTSARHEFITVTSEGFRFRQQIFETIPSLFRWFKDHFREAPPTPHQNIAASAATPYTPGRAINMDDVARVAQNLSGTVLHNLSQAAATRTPGNQYPNTPYTPSGQTPFMTPYLSTPHMSAPSASPHPQSRQMGRRPAAGAGSDDWGAAAEAWARARRSQITNGPSSTPR